MQYSALLSLALAIYGVQAFPSPVDSVVARNVSTTADWKNPVTDGDLADDKLSNMPKSGSEVKCETRDHSNDDIFKAASYAHNLWKKKSPTNKPIKASDPNSKSTPYPHRNSPSKSNKNKIKDGDFKLKDCKPGEEGFLEYPILEDGSLWTDGATDPGPDRILIQYLDDSSAAYCGTIFHFPSGNGRSSAFDLCDNSAGGNLNPYTFTKPSPCSAGGCQNGPPDES